MSRLWNKKKVTSISIPIVTISTDLFVRHHGGGEKPFFSRRISPISFLVERLRRDSQECWKTFLGLQKSASDQLINQPRKQRQEREKKKMMEKEEEEEEGSWADVHSTWKGDKNRSKLTQLPRGKKRLRTRERGNKSRRSSRKYRMNKREIHGRFLLLPSSRNQPPALVSLLHNSV